jgi:CO/xanthine dehydrogenase Mo-binding subunit
VLDIPPVFESIILEEQMGIGPWGATGIGEMSLLAVAPAILDAIHDATGVWLNQVPLTPEHLFWSLKAKEPSNP